MKALTLSLALAAALLAQAPAASASGDTLLVDRVAAESIPMPARGQRMAEVEAAFGAPSAKHAAVAGPGDRAHNPPITRWDYPAFSVYFENDRVIDAVVAKSNPNEIGPKPVQ